MVRSARLKRKFAGCSGRRGEGARGLPDFADEVLGGGADGGGDVGLGDGELGAEPGEGADEVVGDHDLAAAMRAGADADGGDADASSDFAGELGLDELKDEGEGAGFFDGGGVGEKAFAFGFGAALDLVAALLFNRLGEHADVGHDGVAGVAEGVDFGNDGDAALELDGFGAGVGELAGVGDGVSGGLVGVVGEIADDEGSRLGAGDGGDVMLDFGERDVGGVGITEDDHADGVADEEDGDAGFIEQAGGGIVVGGERGDFFAPGLGLGNPVGRDFFHALG